VTDFAQRIATEADIPALVDLMDRAIAGPLADFLSPDQIAASRRLMGIDSQIIADRTYFIVEANGVMAGCGGWSGRITEYGGDHTPGRVPTALTPGVDAARIRAMYTAPEFLRRGVGCQILALCETGAAAAGYDRAELVATLGGEPLYRAAGYVEIERLKDDRGGAPVPLVRMGKRLDATKTAGAR
jgi:GNAT superfamily N-acetyltransferase